MTARLRWAPQAYQEFLSLYVEIGLFSQRTAERLIDKIEEAIQLLPQFPLVGAPRPELGEGLRAVVAGDYLMLYEVFPAEGIAVTDIEILRIVDGRR